MSMANDTAPVLDRTLPSLDGKPVELSQYQGKVVLIVNVASKCGLTPQYKGLQALYEAHAADGLVILGFPCNQFGKQEPGSAEEIAQFCEKNYGVTFPMFAKLEVNGPGADDLYKHLTGLDLKPVGSGAISWNFEKFLINRKGEVVGRFSPRTGPQDEALVSAIKQALAD